MATEATMKEKPLYAQSIQLKAVERETHGELAEKLHFECAYCGKELELHIDMAKLHEQLNEEMFYCNFCLRHRFYTKQQRHILILSFRAIFAHYYYAFYRSNYLGNRMYYSQIAEYIETHATTGLQNPVFYYDPESYLWFIDFSRVGRGKGKIKCEAVLQTISNILLCFNMPQHLNNIRMFDVYERYQEAINRFYSQRNRPQNKRILIPTISGCGAYENFQGYNVDNIRNFSSTDFICDSLESA